MAASRRRLALIVAVVLLLPVLLIITTVAVGAYFWFASSSPPPPTRPLAAIDLPAQPSALAWSPDGAYLAGGTWGGLPPFTDGAEHKGAVYLMDANTYLLTATLDLPMFVRVIAFSPDGKRLAVGTTHPTTPGSASPSELLVCEVPGLKVLHRATAGDALATFSDLAWAPDGSALYAIEARGILEEGTVVRGWTLPGWKELPAFTKPRDGSFNAVALTPDGRTVLVSEQKLDFDPVRLRLYDPATGTELRSFGTTLKVQFPRLAFAPDGQSIAVRSADGTISWLDLQGQSTSAAPRFALPPAVRTENYVSRVASADLSHTAAGEMNRMKLVDFFGGDKYGAFVEVNDLNTGRTWKWRLADEYGNTPAVAFHPDGSKLATSFGHPTGGVIQIWPTPK